MKALLLAFLPSSVLCALILAKRRPSRYSKPLIIQFSSRCLESLALTPPPWILCVYGGRVRYYTCADAPYPRTDFWTLDFATVL